jgi:hypothetical protein
MSPAGWLDDGQYYVPSKPWYRLTNLAPRGPADDDQVIEGEILRDFFRRQDPYHTRRVIGLHLSEDLDQRVEVGESGVPAVVQVGLIGVRRRIGGGGIDDADSIPSLKLPDRGGPLGARLLGIRLLE